MQQEKPGNAGLFFAYPQDRLCRSDGSRDLGYRANLVGATEVATWDTALTQVATSVAPAEQVCREAGKTKPGLRRAPMH
jgi:hypothetical protein